MELMFVLPGFLTSGAVWLYTETVFFIIGMLILAMQLYSRALTLRRAVPWAVAFYAVPIITTIAWMFIGRPVFIRRMRSYAEEEPVPDSILEEDDLRTARAVSRSGTLGCSADSGIEYIRDGGEYYSRLFDDIEAAERTIDIECYLIRRDETSRRFIELLCSKARRGTDVHVIFDDYGYDGGTKKYLRQLDAAGAETALFHNMTILLFSPKKNFRNHRKTVVIDGRITYQGGFNIGDEYLGKGGFGYWRDAAVRIEGPQASRMDRMFLDDWEYTTRRRLQPGTYIAEPCGKTPMQIIPGNSIYDHDNSIEAEFMCLCRSARKRIWIETPYFAPPRAVMSELCTAARSGVDVRIIIPDRGDHPNVYWGNRKSASIIMKAGGRVFEYHKGFLHSKTILVDDDRCSVGSANLDNRSIRLNFECNVLAYSKDLADELGKTFLEDLGESTEYTLDDYCSRGSLAKLKTIIATAFYEQL